MAGDVNRVQPPDMQPMRAYKSASAMGAAAPAFREEGLFEYHLYTLGRPTTVRDKGRSR